MKGSLVVLGVFLVGVFVYDRSHTDDDAAGAAAPEAAAPIDGSTTEFECEGKTRCSQMRSCEEAKFYLRNCPDTQMDGDSDGVPCESQWCSDKL